MSLTPNPFENRPARGKPKHGVPLAAKVSAVHSGNNLPPTRVAGTLPTGRQPAGFETKPPAARKLPVPNAQVATTTAQGLEIVQPKTATGDYAKTYIAQLENGNESLHKLAETEMTSENYQKVYQAQQKVEAELKQALQRQAPSDDFLEQKKRLEQAAENTNKARDLMAKMASLQLKLVPNMDATESYRIHGEIEQLRVALAQIQHSG